MSRSCWLSHSLFPSGELLGAPSEPPTSSRWGWERLSLQNSPLGPCTVGRGRGVLHVPLRPLGFPGWSRSVCGASGPAVSRGGRISGLGPSGWRWHGDFSTMVLLPGGLLVEEIPIGRFLASGPRRAGESTGASPARRLLRVPFKSRIVGLSLITMDTRKIESRICACDLVFECLQKSGRISCRWSGRERSAVRYGASFFSEKICRVWVRSLSVRRNSATGSHRFPIQFNMRFLLYQYLCLEHAELFPLRGKGENIAAKTPFQLAARMGFAACVSECWELRHEIFLPCLSATK